MMVDDDYDDPDKNGLQKKTFEIISIDGRFMINEKKKLKLSPINHRLCPPKKKITFTHSYHMMIIIIIIIIINTFILLETFIPGVFINIVHQ